MITLARSLLAIASIGAIPAIAQTLTPTNDNGAVFVMTNAADRNEIISFVRTPDGHLLNGDRFETGGRGSGGITDPLGSQGSLTLSQDHSYLFAVNAGSGTLSVFKVRRRASLTLVDKAPTAGSQPVSVAQWRNLVYVLNSGGSGNIVVFQLNDNGKLKQIRNSTAFLTANGTGGASIAISPDGQFVVVVERLANNIDVFKIQSDGTLAPIVVNPSPVPGAFAGQFTPSGTFVVSETGPAGVPNGSTVSSYSVMSNGMLTPISQGVPTLGAANCWNAITPDGKWVYVSNTASSNISGFTIGQGGTLTPIGGTVVGANPPGSTNLDMAISSDGKFLYTLNSSAGTIGIFAIQQDGTLTNLGDAGDLPKMVGFNGIAAL